jgi:hypothetical protein
MGVIICLRSVEWWSRKAASDSGFFISRECTSATAAYIEEKEVADNDQEISPASRHIV